jgi:hypothetical protein
VVSELAPKTNILVGDESRLAARFRTCVRGDGFLKQFKVLFSLVFLALSFGA